ncbi:hypothetical protein [Chroococcidiopsis sp. SAG 2025]|nr:hypothetical protein [Chroococcidiopsis sp. SAG 2025]
MTRKDFSQSVIGSTSHSSTTVNQQPSQAGYFGSEPAPTNTCY